MSKILKITDGDYKVKTGYAGTITLDTGSGAGRVVVTGSLDVQGDFTTVQSETLQIKDNVIELNVGETGPGVSLTTAGIIIKRGTGTDTNGLASSDVQIIFDETVQHFDPVTVTNKYGTLIFKYANNTLLGIRTNSINTNGQSLGLINAGNGYITVSGTNTYETKILDYTAWNLAGNPQPAITVGRTTVIDDDRIPNIKAVKDFVDSSLYYFTTPIIAEGDTSVRTYDDSISGGLSRIVFNVNNVERGQFNDNGFNVDNVRLLSNTVSNTDVTQDLTLTAINSNIKVSGYLNLVDQVTAPADTSGVNKLYSKATTGPGNTGLYFVNTRSGENFEVDGAGPEELVSKKRAILFSMIF